MPENHKQPTKEELEENIRKSQEDLDKLDKEEDPPASPSPSEEVPDDIPTPSEEEEDEDDSETPSPSKEVPNDEEDDADKGKSDEDKTKDPDYKKKFSESSREAQKLSAKNRIRESAYREASELPEPTDEELGQEYSDWDTMTDSEKRINKELLINKRFRERIGQGNEAAKKVEQWEQKVDEYIDDPETLVKIPELEGKQDQFAEFAKDEENNSVPFKTLVAAFLHEVEKNKPPKKKGQMFPKGSGGPNDKPVRKDGKLTVDESRILQKTNYKKYTQMLKEGKISTE